MRIDPKEIPRDQKLVDMLKYTAHYSWMRVVKDTACDKLGVRLWMKETAKGIYTFKYDINWADIELYFEEFLRAGARDVYVWCMGVEFSKSGDEKEVSIHIDERQVKKGQKAPTFIAEFDDKTKDFNIRRVPWT